MLSFDAFFSQYNGKTNVGNTPQNKGECVGLVAVWVDNLGLPHIWGDAQDLYANADPKSFDKIPNTPTAIPQKGDIPVWNNKYNGTVGHTGVATGKGDVNTFEAFEQNDPTGSNCHNRIYNYNAVTGWLRPKIVTGDMVISQALYAELVTKATAGDKLQPLYDALVKLNVANEKSIQEKVTKIEQLETQITALINRPNYKNEMLAIKKIIVDSKI